MPYHRAEKRHEDVKADLRRIVIVGPCASGKSTLATALCQHGYDAHVCGQEHSAIADLWQRAGPDVLIALEIDLPTLRWRRGNSWPATLYAAQRRRLAPAFAVADLVLDSGLLTQDVVLARVDEWLKRSARD
jgi:hypothetical protein